MAFTYPIAMPPTGIAGQAFELLRIDYSAPEAGGRIGGVTAAAAKWAPVWTLSGTMNISMSDDWRSWVAALRGSQRMFLGYDRERPFPKLYRAGFAGLNRAGGGAFDGSALTWEQVIATNGDADVILTGLPANFQLRKNDYIGFRWTTGGEVRRALVRAVANSPANSSGVAPVLVQPPVDLRIVPLDAVAYLDNPVALMKLDPAKTELGAMDRMGVIRGGTIAAVQVMLT